MHGMSIETLDEESATDFNRWEMELKKVVGTHGVDFLAALNARTAVKQI